MNNSHGESRFHRDEAICSLGCFQIASQEKKPPAVAGRNDHLLENGFNQGKSVTEPFQGWIILRQCKWKKHAFAQAPAGKAQNDEKNKWRVKGTTKD